MHVRDLQLNRPRLARTLGPHEASTLAEAGDCITICDLVFHPVDRLQGWIWILLQSFRGITLSQAPVSAQSSTSIHSPSSYSEVPAELSMARFETSV